MYEQQQIQNPPFPNDTQLAFEMCRVRRDTGRGTESVTNLGDTEGSTLWAISGTSSWKFVSGVLTSITWAQSRFCMIGCTRRREVLIGLRCERLKCGVERVETVSLAAGIYRSR